VLIPWGGVGVSADIVRVGDKLISKEKLSRVVHRVLLLRSEGLSQQEVADRLQIERTFISRLEGIGEVRKGRRIAVVGFPIENRDQIQQVCDEIGVEFTLLMTEKERWAYIEERSGIDLFNAVMLLLARVRQHDVVVLLGSDQRVRLIEALLDNEVVAVEIGQSPITENKRVDPEEFAALLRAIRDESEERAK